MVLGHQVLPERQLQRRQVLPDRQLQGRQVLPERLLMMKRHQQRSGRHLQLESQEERQENSWKLNSSDTSWCTPLQVRCAGRITTKGERSQQL